jgi:hypothetical protein
VFGCNPAAVRRASRAKSEGALSRPSALALGFVAIVHIAASVGGYLHFALVQHVTCPEHGELIHADATASGVTAHRHADGVPSVEERSPSDDTHDQCSIVASLRSPCITKANAPTLAGPGIGGEQSVRSRKRVHPLIAVWQLAPKTSPPARV